MDIILLTIGKTTLSYINQGIEDFLKRLRRYVNYSIVSIPDIKNTKAMTPEIQKNKEGEKIMDFLSPSDYVILLDEHGKEYSSKDFSLKLQKNMASGRKRLVFVVGGPYGFSQSVYNRAEELISFSRMTFTHEMIRLFFTEQLYRAMTIIKGEPYHHE